MDTDLRRGPFVHVGIHKALSSWLQAEVFTEGGPVDTLGIGYPEVADLLLDIELPDEIPAWVGEMNQLAATGWSVGLSCERLSGYPTMGLWSRSEIAANLHTLFPDGHVLIVIREQRAALRSYYRQFLRDGGAVSPRRLFHERPEPHRLRRTFFDQRYFEYSRLRNVYVESFGADRVTVLPYEQFVQDTGEFLRSLELLAGVSLAEVDPNRRVNAARSPYQLPLLYAASRLRRSQLSQRGVVRDDRLHRLIDKAAGPLDSLPSASAERRVRSWIDAAIDELDLSEYASDNRVLGETLDLDLASYGYLT